MGLGKTVMTISLIHSHRLLNKKAAALNLGSLISEKLAPGQMELESTPNKPINKEKCYKDIQTKSRHKYVISENHLLARLASRLDQKNSA